MTIYEQGKPRPYTPKSKGNAERPIDERIETEVMTPTERQRRRLTASFDEAEKGDLAAKAAWQEDAVAKYVTKVSRYSHRGKVITNGAELAEFGEDIYVAELAAEIYAELSLTEEEKKSSAAQSGSSAPETAPSTGTAAPVSGTDSAGPAAAPSAP